MTYVEQGTQGAFRQTWRKGNPRSLLKTMMEKTPKADAAVIYRMFWDEIEDDKELLRNIVGYWLDHNYQSLRQASEPAPPPHMVETERQNAQTVVRERLHQRIRYETRIVLLDLIMPNDKRLGDCTGAECGRFGGWLFQLSKKVPANKTVSNILSEDEVYKLWQHAKNYQKK